MSERILSMQREEAIIKLLDDESPLVEKALTAELKAHEEAGVTLLRRILRSNEKLLASRAKLYLERVVGPNTAEEFSRFIKSLQYELETGMLLLNRVVTPTLQASHIWPHVDGLARRCRELIVEPITPFEKIKIINRVLFHENGFRGDVDNYEDPLNSFVEPVLRRRKGIPITLSIIYLMVSRRINFELEPIGMPGRFLVASFHDGNALYIDPFERGQIRTAEEVREILRSNQIFPEEMYMMPTPVGEVLCRCCRNLVRQYTAKNNPSKAKLFAGFVREFEETHKQAES
ncbi:MAG: transglutaminase-like domain-containing protein [Verrucomicrobiota bacterium]|nr:transglutaminase-like domain-containing protein [Verrucomicrobiota bacterium]